jgi:DNA-binding NarL/FixJ family response regulator
MRRGTPVRSQLSRQPAAREKEPFLTSTSHSSERTQTGLGERRRDVSGTASKRGRRSHPETPVVEHLMTRLGHLSQGTVLEPTLDKRQNLTRRELQILRLMADGRGTRGSAGDLSISAATVRNHVKSIFSKLGVHSRAEAVGHALRNKLI